MYCAFLRCFAIASTGEFCDDHASTVAVLDVRAKSRVTIWITKVKNDDGKFAIIANSPIKCTVQDHVIAVETLAETKYDDTQVSMDEFQMCRFRTIKANGPVSVNLNAAMAMIDPDMFFVDALNGASIIFQEPVLLEQCNACIGHNSKLDMNDCNVLNLRLLMDNAEAVNFVAGQQLHAKMSNRSVLKGLCSRECQTDIKSSPFCKIRLSEQNTRSAPSGPLGSLDDPPIVEHIPGTGAQGCWKL